MSLKVIALNMRLEQKILTTRLILGGTSRRRRKADPSFLVNERAIERKKGMLAW